MVELPTGCDSDEHDHDHHNHHDSKNPVMDIDIDTDTKRLIENVREIAHTHVHTLGTNTQESFVRSFVRSIVRSFRSVVMDRTCTLCNMVRN